MIAVFFAVAGICRAYDMRVAHVVEQLRDMQEVGSDAVGYAGAPHGFYLLYQYCWYASTDQDLIEMLRDPSSVVRLMGVKCIVTSPYRKIDRSLLEPLRGDTTKIIVGAGGCVFSQMTVGDVVCQMQRDPDFLGPREPRRNKLPEATPGLRPPTTPSPSSGAPQR